MPNPDNKSESMAIRIARDDVSGAAMVHDRALADVQAAGVKLNAAQDRLAALLKARDDKAAKDAQVAAAEQARKDAAK